MKTKNARTQKTRQLILETGHRLVSAKGFVGLGLQELLREAGVPKGSFYHYFSSKEGFGEALIDRYFQEYMEVLESLLQNSSEPGRERILSYFELWQKTQTDPQSDSRCLVVKLSAEVADLSDSMRDRLRTGTDRIIGRLGTCLHEGMDDGSVVPGNPLQLARTLYQLWLGASLLAKLHRNGEPFEQTLEVTRLLLQGLGGENNTLKKEKP